MSPPGLHKTLVTSSLVNKFNLLNAIHFRDILESVKVRAVWGWGVEEILAGRKNAEGRSL